MPHQRDNKINTLHIPGRLLIKAPSSSLVCKLVSLEGELAAYWPLPSFMGALSNEWILASRRSISASFFASCSVNSFSLACSSKQSQFWEFAGSTFLSGMTANVLRDDADCPGRNKELPWWIPLSKLEISNKDGGARFNDFCLYSTLLSCNMESCRHKQTSTQSCQNKKFLLNMAWKKKTLPTSTPWKLERKALPRLNWNNLDHERGRQKVR